MAGYDHRRIEKHWQESWRASGLYLVPAESSKPKYYILDMFPYPSGTGLHVGHPEGYVATDIISRYKRMCGFNVLHPMGFDAFGLPTERQAMIENIHPRIITQRNVATFQRQLSSMGFDYDWSRVVNTTTDDYVRWTQWMFLRMYNSWFDAAQQKARPIDELPIPPDISEPQEIELHRDAHRLAFIASMPVNWCEELGTVLANEEVDEWKEKGYSVERRPMRQWMLRITAYSERLLQGLDSLQWPSSTMEMQRHWIGKSEGALINFSIVDTADTIAVFTTRPDTAFGATYLVFAPDHPLVEQISTAEQFAKVAAYRDAALLKSDLERTELSKTKSGVFTGAYARNPASGEQIPVWVADYVLAHYGTGAIMAVPGHDTRDHAFAQTFGLPILQVVTPTDGTVVDVHVEAFTACGEGVHSSGNGVDLNGLPTNVAQQTMCDWLEREGHGERRIQFRLRDWLFSRQRYWGEPIPIMLFADGTKRALDDDELPLLLPEVDEFKPTGTGESPLATVPTWVDFVDKKTGKQARLETNTMPQWAGSCWYYLRYCDPGNREYFCDPANEQYWMGQQGVDLYVGGAEHAVLHLLYARFWHKVLFDLGHVKSDEPFRRLVHQGLIMGEDGRKMSKSLGNTVNPDDVIHEHGADALRMFEMFLGPLESSKPWNTKGIEGITRFLQRTWRLIVSDDGTLSPLVQDVPCTPEQDFVLHTTIKKTRDDIESLNFNTAIAQFMIFVNSFTTASVRPVRAMAAFVQCIAPFAPHVAEELWMLLGFKESVFLQDFPTVDTTKLERSEVEIVLQVNSKVRSKALVPVGADDETLERIALADDTVQRYLKDVSVRKKIIVTDKLVNFIVG